MLTSLSYLHYWISWPLLWLNATSHYSKPVHQESCQLPPLHRAAKNGDEISIQNLLAQGHDIHASCHQGYSVLHHASAQGNADCVEYLIYNGANIEAKACGGISPLHKAASIGCQQSVKTLLKAGANVQTKDCTGHTPLHAGARFGHIDVIHQLIQYGATPQADQDGYTPLDEAIKYKQRETIVFLLEAFS